MSTYTLPNEKGHFGKYGGRFIPETLMQAVKELESAYKEAVKDKGFQTQLHSLLADYVGRETPLYFAENLTEFSGELKYI